MVQYHQHLLMGRERIPQAKAVIGSSTTLPDSISAASVFAPTIDLAMPVRCYALRRRSLLALVLLASESACLSFVQMPTKPASPFPQVTHDGDPNGSTRALTSPLAPTSVCREPTDQLPAQSRRRFLSAVATPAVTTLGIFQLPLRANAAVGESSDAAGTADGEKDPLQNRPRAPTEALVPATKQRLLLQQAQALASQLLTERNANAGNDDDTTTTDLRQQLESIIERPKTSNGGAVNRKTIPIALRYKMDQQTVQQQQQTTTDTPIPLSGRSLRAALNIYTANLQFGETYVLTASPEVKKQLIRADQLPDVKAVITADLDLRDLYRNKIQTLMEDIAAELYCGTTDWVELNELLKEINGTMNQWFGFIAPQDVANAEALAQATVVELPQPKLRGFNPYLD